MTKTDSTTHPLSEPPPPQLSSHLHATPVAAYAETRSGRFVRFALPRLPAELELRVWSFLVQANAGEIWNRTRFFLVSLDLRGPTYGYASH